MNEVTGASVATVSQRLASTDPPDFYTVALTLLHQVVGLTWVTTRVAATTAAWWRTFPRRSRTGRTTSAAAAATCATSTSRRTSRRPAPPRRSPSVSTQTAARHVAETNRRAGDRFQIFARLYLFIFATISHFWERRTSPWSEGNEWKGND